MTIKETIENFETVFSDLKVMAIYKIDSNKCMVIAPPKGGQTNSVGSPNAYLFMKDGTIKPVNPMEDLDSFIKITSSENQIYNAAKEF